MNKRIFAFLAAVCLLLTGCASLLDRSYSAVEPYTDRYWDTTAEDTLKAESYQDLVNSLLMVIGQRSAECVIRYYTPAGGSSYSHALAARREVLSETILGSYLLDNITVVYSSGENYCTLTFSMSYREGVQDVDTLMALSDTQSLADLLRLSVREEHGSLTARFVSKTSCSEVIDAVDALWAELWLSRMEANGLLTAPEDPADSDQTGEAVLADGPSADSESLDWDQFADENTDGSAESLSPSDEAPPEETDAASPGEESPSEQDFPSPKLPGIEIPPCPWEIRFYPDQEYAEIVEIVLGQ